MNEFPKVVIGVPLIKFESLDQFPIKWFEDLPSNVDVVASSEGKIYDLERRVLFESETFLTSMTTDNRMRILEYTVIQPQIEWVISVDNDDQIFPENINRILEKDPPKSIVLLDAQMKDVLKPRSKIKLLPAGFVPCYWSRLIHRNVIPQLLEVLKQFPPTSFGDDNLLRLGIELAKIRETPVPGFPVALWMNAQRTFRSERRRSDAAIVLKAFEEFGRGTAAHKKDYRYLKGQAR